MAAAIQKLHPTGHRKEFGGEGGPEDKPAAMPKEDANANKTFFGPAGLLKGSASGRHKTSLDQNARPIQSAGRFQRARTRRK